jgi:hypothetical protein
MRALIFKTAVRLAGGSALVISAVAPAVAQSPYTYDEFQPPQVRLNVFQGSGARALGMGGAFLARPDDATAASWNPAGLSYLRRPEFSLAGVAAALTSKTHLDDGSLIIDDHLSSLSPDFVATAYPFELGSISGAGQISFQRVISFGGDRTIKKADPIALNTSGGFDALSAAIGLHVSRQLRLGLTVNRWINGYDATFNRQGASPEERHTEFRLGGWNANAGIIWTPTENLNLGIVGKAPFTAGVKLWRSYQNLVMEDLPSPSDPNARIRTLRPLREFFAPNLRLHFPGAIGVGASWRVSSPVTASIDVTRTFWSDAWVRNFFDLTSPEGQVRPFQNRLSYPTLADLSSSEGTVLDQRDTEQVRLGIEYVIVRERVKIPLRVGFFTDRQYFRVARAPSVVRTLTRQAADSFLQSLDPPARIQPATSGGAPPRFQAFTAGTGISKGPLLLDIAYMLQLGNYIDADGTGNEIKTTSHRFFGSLILRF